MLPPEDDTGSGRFRDGSWTGLLGAVVAGRADMAVNAMALVPERLPAMDFTYPHVVDGLAWTVRRAGPRPRWHSLAMVFPLSGWGCIAFLYLTAAVLLRASRNAQSVTSGLLTAWAGLMQVPSAEPRRWRRFYAPWLAACFLLGSAYSSCLVGLLVEPGYERQVDTMDEILASKKNFGFQSVIDYFLEGDDWRLQALQREYAVVSAQMVEWVVKYDYAYISSRRVASYYQSYAPRDTAGRSRIHVCSFNFVTYGTTTYITKDHPLRDRINDIVFSIASAGLVPKWSSDIEFAARLQHSRTTEPGADGGSPQPLQRRHLDAALALLVLGLAAAAAAFAGELAVHAWRRRRRVEATRSSHSRRAALLGTAPAFGKLLDM
ncbi:glutamate receptor-like [Schistocerca piceifrons]|uniref:glutamate receptor-like n=1 Tax=Schistocerca piceifrons TaxID=274613 RepID=UPI001F5F739E|nr:glutamate receptor-like [Schistocerca piceifrons]